MSLWPDNDLEDALQIVQQNLAQNRYTSLSQDHSQLVREHYRNQLTMPVAGQEVNIYSPAGLLLATGYNRIVVGDYGAYLEIPEKNIILPNICVKPGQEYRFNPEYKVKYFWMMPRDNSHVKIYFQQRKVDYADYQPGMYYISPGEVKISAKT
ncbi:hypothetical protein [Bacteroides sp.]|uniref:hypothetical protein n=1 Tax=Bacteroides sp. TaxID=29523 RepID=UPI00263A20D6|nr:hypothetical protein [Bacteroides sp.]MDD3040422.1 hypothetical protein [Bacteroides sp.]